MCIVSERITTVSCPEAIDADDDTTCQAGPMVVEQAENKMKIKRNGQYVIF